MTHQVSEICHIHICVSVCGVCSTGCCQIIMSLPPLLTSHVKFSVGMWH